MAQKHLTRISYLQTTYQELRKRLIQRCEYWKKDYSDFVIQLQQRDHKFATDLAALAANFTSADYQPSQREESELARLEGELTQLDYETKYWWQKLNDSILFLLIVAFCLRTYVFGLYYVPSGSAERTLLVGDRIYGNKMAYYFSDVQRGDLAIFDNPDVAYDRKGTLTYLWQRYIGFGVPLLGIKAGPDAVVKRIIGIPGDVLEGKIEEGRAVLYLNGKKLEEPYLNPYPLIGVRRELGLISPTNPLAKFLPEGFVKHKQHTVWYTHVPGIALDKQPYYKLQPDEVVKSHLSGQPIYRFPETPWSVDSFMKIRIPEGKYWMQGDSRKNSRDSRSWGLVDASRIHGRAACVIFSIDTEELFWIFELIKHPIDFWKTKLRWDRFLVFPKNGVLKDLK